MFIGYNLYNTLEWGKYFPEFFNLCPWIFRETEHIVLKKCPWNSTFFSTN